MSNKQKLDRYVTIKAEISRLEEEMKSIQPEIIALMEEGQAEVINHEAGKFTLGRRRTWEYSSNVKNLEVNLKEAKQTEEQNGTATYTEKPYLIFKSAE